MIDYIAMKTLEEICEKHNLTRTEVLSRRRNRRLMPCRVEIAKALRALKLSYPDIGKIMGDRDHSSIMHYMNWQPKITAQTAPEYATEDAQERLSSENDAG